MGRSSLCSRDRTSGLPEWCRAGTGCGAFDGLPPALKTFTAGYPDIEIEVDAASRIVDLTRREAEVALRASTSPPEHFVGRQVAELRYAVYGVPEVVPSAPYKLSGLPWLGFLESLSYLAIARRQRAQSGNVNRCHILSPPPVR